MRIAVACLFLEANSFATGWTTLEQFRVAGLHVGAELRRELLPQGLELASAWDALAAAGAEVVPALFAWSPPGPMLSADAFLTLTDAIVSRVDETLDGVYLQLHGSALADGVDDPEGVLLQAVRQRLRPGVPIAISLDLHATMTPSMAGAADIVTAYRTCPHMDLARTGRQAAELLVAAVRGEAHPVVAVVQLPMTTPPGRHDNEVPAFRALMEACSAAETLPGVLAAVVLPSQPWMDVADLGWSTVVTADADRARAAAVARDLGLLAWTTRAEFTAGDVLPIAAALRLALAGPAPYVVADSGDATNGGSTGDSTELLRAALGSTDRRIQLTIADASAAATLRATRVGTRVAVSLGSGEPGTFNEATPVEGVVVAHPAGRFTYSHPFSRGLRGDLGTCAVLGIGQIRVVVHARPVGLIDPEAYRGAGLDPAVAEVLQAKSHISYRAGFAPLTARSVVAATPGPTTADLHSLRFSKRRVPLYPFEEPPDPFVS